MKATKEEMKQEALLRMDILKLDSRLKEQFDKENRLYYSAHGQGVLCLLTTEIQEAVRAFETLYGYLVYHVIDDVTAVGRMLTLLYVCPEKGEWSRDRKDIAEGYPLAYVVNLDCEAFSEFGSVGVVSANGGVVRTA